MKEDKIKKILMIIGGLAILILIANVFIYLLPVFLFLGVMYYLYCFYFKGKKGKREYTKKGKNSKNKNIQEAEVIKEEFDNKDNG